MLLITPSVSGADLKQTESHRPLPQSQRVVGGSLSLGLATRCLSNTWVLSEPLGPGGHVAGLDQWEAGILVFQAGQGVVTGGG